MFQIMGIFFSDKFTTKNFYPTRKKITPQNIRSNSPEKKNLTPNNLKTNSH